MFLLLYTITVNTPNNKGTIEPVEGCLFAFALGFLFDELVKMYLSNYWRSQQLQRRSRVDWILEYIQRILPALSVLRRYSFIPYSRLVWCYGLPIFWITNIIQTKVRKRECLASKSWRVSPHSSVHNFVISLTKIVVNFYILNSSASLGLCSSCFRG